MFIVSISGDILFQSPCRTRRKTLEHAARERVPLRYANLRQARLQLAKLDDLDLHGACLWGVDLSCTHISCPSFWNQSLEGVHIKGSIFWHFGETRCTITPITQVHPPITSVSQNTNGLPHRYSRPTA